MALARQSPRPTAPVDTTPAPTSPVTQTRADAQDSPARPAAPHASLPPHSHSRTTAHRTPAKTPAPHSHTANTPSPPHCVPPHAAAMSPPTRMRLPRPSPASPTDTRSTPQSEYGTRAATDSAAHPSPQLRDRPRLRTPADLVARRTAVPNAPSPGQSLRAHQSARCDIPPAAPATPPAVARTSAVVTPSPSLAGDAYAATPPADAICSDTRHRPDRVAPSPAEC